MTQATSRIIKYQNINIESTNQTEYACHLQKQLDISQAKITELQNYIMKLEKKDLPDANTAAITNYKGNNLDFSFYLTPSPVSSNNILPELPELSSSTLSSIKIPSLPPIIPKDIDMAEQYQQKQSTQIRPFI